MTDEWKHEDWRAFDWRGDEDARTEKPLAPFESAAHPLNVPSPLTDPKRIDAVTPLSSLGPSVRDADYEAALASIRDAIEQFKGCSEAERETLERDLDALHA